MSRFARFTATSPDGADDRALKRLSLPVFVLLCCSVVAGLSGGCAGGRSPGVLDLRDVARVALDQLRSFEGPVILVVPDDTDPRVLDVLTGMSDVVVEREFGDLDAIPAGHALFEGIVVQDGYAELGARVGPFDRSGTGRARCGTKYRLMLARSEGRWVMHQYIVGGC